MDDVNLNRPTQNGEGNVLTVPEMQRPPADSPNDRAAQTLWGGWESERKERPHVLIWPLSF